MTKYVLALALMFAPTCGYSQTIQDHLRQAAEHIAAAQALAGPPVVLVQPSTAQAQLDAAASGSVLQLDVQQTYPALVLRTNGVTLTTASHVPQPLATVMGKALITGRLEIRASNVTVAGVAVGGQNVNDIVRSVAGGISILASDDTTRNGVVFQSVPARNISFTGLRIENMGVFAGNGRTIYISKGHSGPLDGLTLDGVIVTKGGWINSAFLFNGASQVLGLVVRNSTFYEGAYGTMAANGPGVGEPALTFAAPGYVWENNTVIRDVRERTIRWPVGTILQ